MSGVRPIFAAHCGEDFAKSRPDAQIGSISKVAMPDMKRAALSYARDGLKVLPVWGISRKGICDCGDKDCVVGGSREKQVGKHPILNGVTGATTDLAEIARIYTEYPNANIAITPSPRPDGNIWFSIDVDVGMRQTAKGPVERDGVRVLRELERENGEPLPDDVQQITGSGGSHTIMVRPPDSDKLTKIRGVVGVDCVDEGKYIIVAPSMHKSGERYRWDRRDWMPDGDPVDNIGKIFDQAPFAPDWLLNLNKRQTRQRDGRGGRDDGDDNGNDLRRLAKKTDLAWPDFCDAVMAIPNSNDPSNPKTYKNYDQYFEILCGIHYESDGSEEGRELAHAWAEKSGEYKDWDVDHRWNSIYDSKDAGGMASGRFLVGLAIDAGYDVPASEEWEKACQALNKDYAFVMRGGHARILHELVSETTQPEIEYIGTQDFGLKFANRIYPKVDVKSETKYEALGGMWLRWKKRRSYETTRFMPDPAEAEARKNVYNTYPGFAVKPATHRKPLDHCGRIVDHVYEITSSGVEEHGLYQLAWCAHIVQRPWEKPGVALVLRSPEEGTGKTTLGTVMQKILGSMHAVIDHEGLVSQFNSIFETTLLAQLDEAAWSAGQKGAATLRTLISDPFMNYQAKGVDRWNARNYTRTLMSSNKDWVVPVGEHDRRYAVFDVSARQANRERYFDPLYREIENGGAAAFLQYLLEFDLSRVKLKIPPMTQARADQKMAGAPITIKFMQHLIDTEDGEIWGDAAPGRIEHDRLYSMLESYFAKLGNKSRFEKRAEGIILNRWFPHLESRKLGNRNRRVWFFEFGTLAQCRAAINKKIGGEAFNPLDDVV
jgi:hypothetical protein